MSKSRFLKMPRIPNRVGGGAQTNINGLHFEQTTDLKTVFESLSDFTVVGNIVYRNNLEFGKLYPKHSLYTNLLIPNGVDYRVILSKKLLPDDSILIGDTLYIIEKKFQSGSGSVDEKLQTCDFKKKQYQKLLEPLNIIVEYYYFLSEWFEKPEYNDVKEYIVSVGCKYFFNEIPLTEFVP